MFILTKCLWEYMSHIFFHVYIGVVDYLASVQIQTIVVTTVDVVGESLNDSGGDDSESSLIVAVDWEWW